MSSAIKAVVLLQLVHEGGPLVDVIGNSKTLEVAERIYSIYIQCKVNNNGKKQPLEQIQCREILQVLLFSFRDQTLPADVQRQS